VLPKVMPHDLSQLLRHQNGPGIAKQAMSAASAANAETRTSPFGLNNVPHRLRSSPS
jgi:hypothetical protein